MSHQDNDTQGSPISTDKSQTDILKMDKTVLEITLSSEHVPVFFFFSLFFHKMQTKIFKASDALSHSAGCRKSHIECIVFILLLQWQKEVEVLSVHVLGSWNL